MIKINKDCHSIYGGLVPQSFVLMFVNMLLSNIFQVFVTEMIFNPLITRAKRAASVDSNKYEYAKIDNIDVHKVRDENNCKIAIDDDLTGSSDATPGYDDPENGGEFIVPLIQVPTDTQNASIKGGVDPLLLVGYKAKLYFLRLQFIFAIMSIVAAFINISEKHSPWVQYQNFYGLILNSSVMTLIGAGEAISHEGKELLESADLSTRQRERIKEVDYEVNMLTRVPIIFVVPSVLSHILPAICAYVYMVPVVLLGFGLPLYGLLFLTNQALVYAGATCLINTASSRLLGKLYTQAMSNLVPKLVVVICAQIFYDYATYLYDVNYPIGGFDYVHVIVQEYDLRSQTFCLVEQKVASLMHILVMFSWL